MVNLHGKEYLGDCLRSVSHLNYLWHKLEVITVDNGSQEGSQVRVQHNPRQVKLIQNKRYIGFQGHQSARSESQGEYAAFVNKDMKVEPDCLVELLVPFVNSLDVAWVGQGL